MKKINSSLLDILDCAYLAQDAYNKDEYADYSKDGYYLPKEKYLIARGWVGLSTQKDSAMNLISKKFKKSDNFFARLYGNLITLQTVISFRGTVFRLKGDLYADIDIGLNKSSRQDHDAKDFYILARNFLIKENSRNFSRLPILTGHSLGGYLAQSVLVHYKTAVVVAFNAPKVASLFSPHDYHLKKIKYQNYINNVDVDEDVIHQIGRPIGKEYRLSGDHSVFIAEAELFFEMSNFNDYASYKQMQLLGSKLLNEHSIATIISILNKTPTIAYKTVQ